MTQTPDGAELEQRPDGSMISHLTVNGMTLSRPFRGPSNGSQAANWRDIKRSGGYLGSRFGALTSRTNVATDPDGIEDVGTSDPFAGMCTSQEEFDAHRAKRRAAYNARRVSAGLEPDAQPNDIGRLGDP